MKVEHSGVPPASAHQTDPPQPSYPLTILFTSLFLLAGCAAYSNNNARRDPSGGMYNEVTGAPVDTNFRDH